MVNCPGLLVCSIELSSRCNKNCFMCGRRKIEKAYPELADWGDMEFSLLEKIAKEMPKEIMIQYHVNGESTLYPRLKEALQLFPNNIRCFNTNAILLLEKANDIIDNLDSLTISVIEDDNMQDEQYEIVKRFLAIKGDRKPNMVYRLLEKDHKYIKILPEAYKRLIDKEKRWYELPGIVATRILHSPMGSFDYEKKVTIPEHGFCLDLISHLVIDRWGDFYPCIRFNPNKLNRLGNIKDMTIEEAWNSEYRQNMIKEHLNFNRKVVPLCDKCHFYGCPTGNQ